MKLLIHGATGHMGRTVARLAEENGHTLAALVDINMPEGSPANCYSSLAAFEGEADCVIDFSFHGAVEQLMLYCVRRHLPVVVCTTGHTAEECAFIEQASREIPVFFAANMSVGVALVSDLARRAAAAFPNAEIEIVEKHHNRKIDVPSGTALAIAHEIEAVREESNLVIGRHENGKRERKDIGIHSLRLGNEVGTHEIIIATGTETITIKHEAEDRALFADGALAAAQFLVRQGPGLYNMKDFIGG